MDDIRAHIEVSQAYPTCPSCMHVYIKSKPRFRPRFLTEKDGTLKDYETNEPVGTWWCHSSICIEISSHVIKDFFKRDDDNMWTNSDGTAWISWSKKREQPSADGPISLTPFKTRRKSQSVVSTPNMSRFRMSILPTDKLDGVHSRQLECMGLRICFHSEIGRILVSSRKIEDGEVLIYSQVPNFDVQTDDDVHGIIHPDDPSCCYLLVPRTKKLYYNKGSFSHEDPVASGDLWYLVNHSPRPNVDVVLRKRGIQFKAKRVIQPNEPITWTYPHGFFGKDEISLDLPQNILPDDAIENRIQN